MINWYRVGKIVNTQGIHGDIRIISSTDFPEKRYAVGATLYIEHPELKDKLAVTVSGYRTYKNFHIIKMEGYTNINEVEKFKGGTLFVPKESLTELDEGEFYYHEIIGCAVMTEDGEELGEVTEVLSPGANDVWVIERKGHKDLLIPYIDQVVKDVNIAEKMIKIHVIPGLLE
jgi:16S rRNA processing protein RimM